ncbi:hypothetical protein [Nannocystis pusilla]|uniref:hypothetical protein n=1 Tax=Nannocystis pusilla TaxID=889268 RepID=UPI003B798F5A
MSRLAPLRRFARGDPLAGCFEATPWPPCTLEAGPECFDSTGIGQNGEPGSTTGETIPTGGVQTVTGAATTSEPDATTTTSATTGAAENVPPAIESFSVDPDHLGEAGTAQLHLVASEDAVEVRLSVGGKLLAELAPAAFPYPFEVLSGKFNGQHNFEAIAVDAEGLESAPATATLTVNAPSTGTEKCLFDADKNDAGVVLSMVEGLVYANDAIVAVGTRDTGAGPRLTVWKLGRDQCEVLPGWPKSGFGKLGNEMSGARALTLDADGNMIVAGFVLDGITPRRYLAMLNSGGSVLWDDLGPLGEEIAGVAVAPKPQAAVFAVGWRRSKVDPSPTDAAIWIYKLDGTPFPPDYLAAPFTPDEEPDEFNDFSEKLRAVVFEPITGHALAVGEREFKGDINKSYSRTFLVRLHPLAGRVGTPWTSNGAAFNHDAALALSTCGDELVAAGWRRDLVGDDPQPVLQWFKHDGTFTEMQPIAVTAAQFSGVACDREGKIVSAGVRDLGQIDAIALATPRSGGAPTWYEKGTSGEDEAAAVSCDGRGFCAWGGFRTEAGKRHAVVRVHHP